MAQEAIGLIETRGFVGATESKALLAEGRHGIPFLTVLGRRGGSAIASAAFNAIAKGMAS